MTYIKKDLTAFLLAIILSAVLGKIIIILLKRFKAKQSILTYVDNHKQKSGTATMGGLIFALSTIILFIFFAKPNSRLAFITLFIGVSFLIVGFLDDFIKVKFSKNEGLTARQKLFFQIGISLIIAIFIFVKGYTKFFIPFLNIFIDLRLVGAIIVFFTFIATTNCVNLTDGLDGLAGGVCLVYLICMYFIISLQVNIFNLNYVTPEECENLATFCLIQAGSIMGFLIFNTYKASVFMGDTGSLYLGGIISAISIFSANTLFILIIGIMFVLSGISVIVQVVYYKLTKKRVFLMSPLHHHFEYKGISESKIGYVYGLITLAMGVISVISLFN